MRILRAATLIVSVSIYLGLAAGNSIAGEFSRFPAVPPGSHLHHVQSDGNENSLLGRWEIEFWENADGEEHYLGYLDVSQGSTETNFTGLLYARQSQSNAWARQSMAITMQDFSIVMVGTIVETSPLANWYPDSFTMKYSNDRLIGYSTDTTGDGGQVRFAR